MMKAMQTSAQTGAQVPESKLPISSKPQQQAGYATQDTMTRGPAPASMSFTAPAPQQSFERNALKAPTCPGLCWPADEDCCYYRDGAARVCCIKIG